jgi:hypothetical protein
LILIPARNLNHRSEITGITGTIRFKRRKIALKSGLFPANIRVRLDAEFRNPNSAIRN